MLTMMDLLSVIERRKELTLLLIVNGIVAIIVNVCNY